MLDVRRLRVLREVARCGSLTAAAEALSYTPSAVSQQIAALERQAGMALIERRPRGVLLTAAGRVLVEYAERVLDELDAAEAALAEFAAVRQGKLWMASFATAAGTIVPRAVDAFRARYPEVEIRVEQATSAAAVARLRQGSLDLALTVDQRSTPEVEITELFTDPFRVALHRGHPLAAQQAVRLADLAGESWIDVPGSPESDVLPRAFARLGVSYRVGYESDDYTAIHELVGAGLGVALLPDLALFPANDEVVLRPLAPASLFRRIQAATRPEPLRSPSASAMLAILRELKPRRRTPPPADTRPQTEPTQPVSEPPRR